MNPAVIKKGDEVIVTKNGGAVYRGIFHKYTGSTILLSDVKMCDREDSTLWLVNPYGKKAVRRFHVDDIKSIVVSKKENAK